MSTLDGRSGPFWDAVAGRVAVPPAARTLGWDLQEVDPDAGTVRVAFDARPEFANSVGVIQGGFLAAMLDDTMGPALIATLDPDQFAPTIELKVSFLRSARPGRLVGTPGWCTGAGRSPSSPVSCATRPARWWPPPARQPGSSG